MAPTSIADIAGRRGREVVAIDTTSNSLLPQSLRNQVFERAVEPAEQYGNPGASAPMDRDDGVASQNEFHASRFVESLTRNVKAGVIFRGPRSLEQIEIETVARHHAGQTRRRRFDLTSMRSDDRDTGSSTRLFDDFVVDAFALGRAVAKERISRIKVRPQTIAMAFAGLVSLVLFRRARRARRRRRETTG